MSAMNTFKWFGIGVIVLAGANLASAQHNWQRTITVDPREGAADHQTITAAIGDQRIGDDPSERYTILILAGTYPEGATLGDLKENVDLVGIDRDAVIIKPPAATDPNEPVYGITISGSDARNNTIRNLTIVTDDDIDGSGHGIVIKHAGTGGDPTNVKILDVTINCKGDDSNGLDVEDSATDLEIRNTRITTADGHGTKIIKGDGAGAPANITIEGVTIEAGGSDQDGIYASETENLRIANCKITSTNGHGIEIVNTSESTEAPRDILLHDLTIRAAGEDKYAIRAEGAEGVPEKQRLRVSDLLLYDESAVSEPNRGARKP